MGHLKSFRESVRGDLERDAAFRQSLLGEAVSCMVSGDIQTGKVVLREYVNGTVGFTKLGEAMGRSPKSLMRMLGPQGNPAARNLFQMIAYLQQAEGLVLEVRATPLAAA